jgi:hypothetical protein
VYPNFSGMRLASVKVFGGECDFAIINEYLNPLGNGRNGTTTEPGIALGFIPEKFAGRIYFGC